MKTTMSMFYNNANCDIYIGKGAGKKLMEDIQNARKSIKIISPFLSPFLIKELIDLRSKGLEIQLITMDSIEDYKDSSTKNIYQLIRQHREVNEAARLKRNKWKKAARILLSGILFITVFTIVLFLYMNDIRMLAGIIPAIIMLFVFFRLIKKIRTQRIYYYSYSRLFPFKVCISPDKHPGSNMYIHGKVYIIDDSIVYLGSLNFTASGTRYNYETRVRTTHAETVKRISDEFYDLFHNSHIPEVDIHTWGRSLYPEPIN